MHCIAIVHFSCFYVSMVLWVYLWDFFVVFFYRLVLSIDNERAELDFSAFWGFIGSLLRNLWFFLDCVMIRLQEERVGK